jgi:hypothetical protein
MLAILELCYADTNEPITGAIFNTVNDYSNNSTSVIASNSANRFKYTAIDIDTKEIYKNISFSELESLAKYSLRNIIGIIKHRGRILVNTVSEDLIYLYPYLDSNIEKHRWLSNLQFKESITPEDAFSAVKTIDNDSEELIPYVQYTELREKRYSHGIYQVKGKVCCFKVLQEEIYRTDDSNFFYINDCYRDLFWVYYTFLYVLNYKEIEVLYVLDAKGDLFKFNVNNSILKVITKIKVLS